MKNLKTYFLGLVPKPLLISILGLAYLLVSYELLRLGFLIANRQYFAGISAGQVLWAFVYGLRFDVSALLMLNAVILLLYNLPGFPGRQQWYSKIILALFWLANLAGFIVNLVDYGYFGFTQRRLMFELFAMPKEIMHMVPGLIGGYWHSFLLLAAAIGLFIYTSRKLFKKLDKSIHYRFNIFSEILSLLLITGLAVLGIRGGLQSKPIRQNHAFFSQHRAAGYLALNSTFTVLRSLSQPKLGQFQFMPREQAQGLVEAMLRDSNETMANREYPFLRQKQFPDSEKKLNVAIFIMESWSAGQIGAIVGGPSATPFFDSLAQHGILYTNFMANSQRSLEAVPAILTSIPAFYNNNSLIGSQAEMNRVLGLGHILLKRGYTTSFHHGAKVGSMGLDAYARTAGFLNYYGKEDFPGLADSMQDGTWGVYDEEFFLDALSRINSFKKPFASVIFSLSPHDPLKIPRYREALFAGFKDDDKFRRALRYSDHSLKVFFEKAKDEDWYGNTIFIIIGDHPYHSMRNSFTSIFQVPLLIYRPQGLVPVRNDGIASQVDILPTLLDLLNCSAIHASMGGSLLSGKEEHYAVVRHGAEFAVFDDRMALSSDLEKINGLYDYRNDGAFKNDLQTAKPAEARKLLAYLQAYIQQASHAIAKDRICRAEDVK
ncbi:sulfatase-like hydrolase/transferase [candidate division TA06 bacterium]|uniref:Sulfatase-like hydrolase/transferase n=1 Tax=candidate division TA06 bacterium TaxID=2250710 RepID=A0A933ICY2_UNCT6|nr:sulfatase-like hydrolase/transferase [candidate division TA06 bacterium]